MPDALESHTELQAIAEELRAAHGELSPRVGLVLGSGLGAFADTLTERVNVPYGSIRGMVPASVAGHAGELCFARRKSLPCAVMRGRLHLYEGHGAARVVFGVRLMIAMGARVVIVTNAAGGIREDLVAGTLMRIDDHINLTGENPLCGAASDQRFVDMGEAYDRQLGDIAADVAAAAGIELASGVYAGVLGPSYETPAEIRMLRALGADAVGMSTVLETIAARQLRARVLGLSCITNAAAGRDSAPLDHGDVQRAAADAAERFATLVGGVLDVLETGAGAAA